MKYLEADSRCDPGEHSEKMRGDARGRHGSK